MQAAEREEMKRYGALRPWATFLTAVGWLSMVAAAIGTIVWAVEGEGFWQVLGVLVIGGPVSIFLASFPLAAAQSMNALADVAETVTVPR
jgi:hypothetical protein